MLFGKQLVPDPHRFYDGGVDAGPGRAAEPPNPHAAPRIVLRRIEQNGVEQWGMLHRIGYRDREYGDILVPRDTDTFESDLTSVPWLFRWLVPRTGRHLPAALLHDGLIGPLQHSTYVSVEGHRILRAHANRVLRDAMADTGTGLVRRWLMWTAVTADTMWSGRWTGWSTGRRWSMRAAVTAMTLIVVVLGAIATLDLFRVGGVPVLPWMDQASFAARLGGGLAGAVVIPLVLGLAWGPFRVAGWIFGITLAVLLHVSAALLLLSGLYEALEWLAARARLAFTAVGLVVLVAAVVGFVVALS